MDKTTNVMRLLKAAGIQFTPLEYEVNEDDLSAQSTARKLGVPAEQVFKTLVLRGDKTGLFVCCVPSDEEIDLKKAAKVSGNKSCEMLHVKDLLQNVGYVRGACSPIGMKKDFPAFFDETVILFDEICISAGTKGVMLRLSPDDLLTYRGAKTADLLKGTP